MDDPYSHSYNQSISAAPMDYQTIHDMLQQTIDFPYTQSHIMSDSILRIIRAELEYWHDLAIRLRSERDAFQTGKG